MPQNVGMLEGIKLLTIQNDAILKLLQDRKSMYTQTSNAVPLLSALSPAYCQLHVSWQSFQSSPGLSITTAHLA